MLRVRLQGTLLNSQIIQELETSQSAEQDSSLWGILLHFPLFITWLVLFSARVSKEKHIYTQAPWYLDYNSNTFNCCLVKTEFIFQILKSEEKKLAY